MVSLNEINDTVPYATVPPIEFKTPKPEPVPAPDGLDWAGYGQRLDVPAVDLEGGWAASFGELATARVANDMIGETPFVVFWQPGASSALDRRSIPDGRDVGQTVAFDRRLGDRTLTFAWRDGLFVDLETGTTWDLAGRAVRGPLAGKRLTSIAHGNHFWFAWAVFRPDTRVWTGS